MLERVGEDASLESILVSSENNQYITFNFPISISKCNYLKSISPSPSISMYLIKWSTCSDDNGIPSS